MTLSVGLHRPTAVRVEYFGPGEYHPAFGAVTFQSDRGAVSIYMTPAAATAVVAAFNAAMQPAIAEAAE